MQNLSILFIFSLFLAFFTGQLTTHFDPDRVPEPSEIQEINQVLEEVVQTVSPLVRLDLNSIYGNRSLYELFMNNPSIVHNNRNSLIDECDREMSSSLYINEKQQVWLDYKCSRIRRLPPNFFSTKPYTGPNGESYLYLAYKLGRFPFSEYSWVYRNLHLYKPMELKNLGVNLNEEFSLLSQFTNQELQLLLKNAKMIQSKDLILLKTGYLQYFVISIRKLNKILSASLFQISTNSKCSFIVGNVCWSFKEISLLKRLNNRTYISFLITLVLLLFISFLIYRNIETQRVEQERKKHAFRILTHELRTPISSMLLLLDRATSNASGLNRETQATLLEVESEVYRLKQLAQKSESILNSDNVQKYKFSKELVSDLNSFLVETIKQDDVTYEIEDNISFLTDHYWFALSIQNLVDNAYKHGKPPVTIKAKKDQNKITIYIEDHGYLNSSKIELLSQDFSKDKGGLGMGLIIVKKTLLALNMKFKISNTNPTQFKIEIPLEKNND